MCTHGAVINILWDRTHLSTLTKGSALVCELTVFIIYILSYLDYRIIIYNDIIYTVKERRGPIMELTVTVCVKKPFLKNKNKLNNIFCYLLVCRTAVARV